MQSVAEHFNVARSFVQKLLKQQDELGHLQAGQQGGAMKPVLAGCEAQLEAMVERQPDATLAEYCQYWGETYQQWVSTSTMCRALQKAGLTRKKTLRSSQASTERVQKLRVEYWEKVQPIDSNNLVFLDEMGVLLGISRTHARSPQGR